MVNGDLARLLKVGPFFNYTLLGLRKKCFMKIEDKNFQFEYGYNILPNRAREQFLKERSNLWFEAYIDEINLQAGTIYFFLKADSEDYMWFENMETDLSDKLYERTKLFQNRGLQSG